LREKDQGAGNRREFDRARVLIGSVQENQTTMKSNLLKEDQSTVAMTSDRTAVEAKPPDLQLPTQNTAASTVLPNQDIVDLLSRWQKVDDGTITTATTGQIDAFTIPDQFFSITQVARKLEGYQGIKGTFRVKILVNGNPSQQGILMMRYIPQATAGGMLTNLRNADLVTKTQVPTVRLYINDTSEVEMEVPFISPNLFHDLMTGGADWGVVYFDVESPLKCGLAGSNTCSYTVMMCMDPSSVQLYNPTYNLAPFPLPIAFRAGESDVIMNKMKTFSRKKGAPSEGAAESTGSVSRALTLVSAGARAVGGLIPTLSAVVMPVSWAAGVASRIVSAFGYSKPLADGAPLRNTNGIDWYHPNCDGVTIAQNLGTTSMNKVEGLPGFAGSAVDEMSLSYLVQKETYHTQFNWAHDTTAGTPLLQIPLRPNYFQTTIVGPPLRSLAGPLGYLSNFFWYYHGAILLTLRFSKTARHQGRMVVVFYPGNLSSDPGYANAAYAPQEIIDISTGNEWTFKFPYTSQKYYEKCSVQYGRVLIYVMNELTGDSTVADNIDCLVYVSAEENFEYALPRVNNGVIISPGVDEVVMNKSGAFQRKAVHVTVGNTKSTDQGDDYAKYCQGERILSIKQLLAAPREPTFLDATLVQFYRMRPFTIGISVDNTAPNTGDWSGDPWSQFAPLYAYSRGGVVLGTWVGNNDANHLWWIQPNNDSSTKPWSTAISAPGSYTNARKVPENIMYSSVYVPQYTQNQCRLNRVSSARGGIGTPEPVDQYSSQTLVYLASRSGAFTSLPKIFRSAADDTQFGFFLGVPPYAIGDQTITEAPPAPLQDVACSMLSLEVDKGPFPHMVDPAHSPSASTDIPMWARKKQDPVPGKKTTGLVPASADAGNSPFRINRL
jgi:hypothetical protein